MIENFRRLIIAAIRGSVAECGRSAPPPFARPTPSEAGQRLAQEAEKRRRANRSAWVHDHIKALQADITRHRQAAENEKDMING